jgi:hypothetical protein
LCPKPTKADGTASAGTNMVFILTLKFYAPYRKELPVAQLDFGLRLVIFEKPREKNYKHLKALYLKSYINGHLVNKMLVDTGATVNIMPYSVLRWLGHQTVTSNDVINFIKEYVIHRFGIPQTIITDGGSVFKSEEFKKFTVDVEIKLIISSLYYAQADGQAETSNQNLIKLIKRKIDEHPRRWHEVLSEALWAHCILCRGATKTSPYHLVYGQETVLL